MPDPEDSEMPSTTGAGAGAVPLPPPDEAHSKSDVIWGLELGQLENDHLKPVLAATIDLHSTEPDKKKARDKSVENYTKAVADDGDVGKRYKELDSKFKEAAADIVKSPDSQELLKGWIATNLSAGKEILSLMDKRAKLRARLDQLSKDYRFAREMQAKAELAFWAKRYSEWSTPEKYIAASIEGYSKDLNLIDAEIDVGSDPAWPIYRFWFSVAPKHLQLRRDAVSKDNAPGFDQLETALTGADLSTRLDELKSGVQRADGAVYLINPADLTAKRSEILGKWEAAAKAYAKAVLENKYWPDEPGKLTERIKALTDGEAAAVKDLLIH